MTTGIAVIDTTYFRFKGSPLSIAQNIRRKLKVRSEFMSQAIESITRDTYKDPKELLLEEIDEISIRCGINDWDNEGARGLNKKSVEYIQEFVCLLPDNASLPQPAPEPSGWMGLEWVNRRDNLYIALSIDSKGELVYAILDHTGQRSATLQFSNEIPEELILFLNKI